MEPKSRGLLRSERTHMEEHNPPDTFGNGAQGPASPGEGALRCGGADSESPLGKKPACALCVPLCGALRTHLSKEENKEAILLVPSLIPSLKAPKENLWLGNKKNCKPQIINICSST